LSFFEKLKKSWSFYFSKLNLFILAREAPHSNISAKKQENTRTGSSQNLSSVSRLVHYRWFYGYGIYGIYDIYRSWISKKLATDAPNPTNESLSNVDPSPQLFVDRGAALPAPLQYRRKTCQAHMPAFQGAIWKKKIGLRRRSTP